MWVDDGTRGWGREGLGGPRVDSKIFGDWRVNFRRIVLEKSLSFVVCLFVKNNIFVTLNIVMIIRVNKIYVLYVLKYYYSITLFLIIFIDRIK